MRDRTTKILEEAYNKIRKMGKEDAQAQAAAARDDRLNAMNARADADKARADAQYNKAADRTNDFIRDPTNIVGIVKAMNPSGQVENEEEQPSYKPGQEEEPHTGKPYWNPYGSNNTGSTVPPSSNKTTSSGNNNQPKQLYYIAGNGQRVGPLSVDQFNSIFTQHQANPNTYVWGTGMPNWMKYKDFSVNRFLKEEYST